MGKNSDGNYRSSSNTVVKAVDVMLLLFMVIQQMVHKTINLQEQKVLGGDANTACWL